MRSTFIAAAALSALVAAPALAAGLDEPVSEPFVPAPAEPAPAFVGGYVGGSLGYGSLDASDTEDAIVGSFGFVDDPEGFVADAFELEDGGLAYGLHAGYNVQRGSVVFGPELAVFGSEAEVGGATDFDDDLPEDIIDAQVDYGARLALRGGVARGRTLVYGTLGVAYLNMSFDISGPDFGDFSEDPDGFGYAAGLGVERLVSDRASLGLQYTLHRFEDFDTVNDVERDIEYRTLDLRVSYTF